MEATNHYRILIEKYFSGSLSKEEERLLEEQLKEPGFRRAFELAKGIEDSFDAERRNHPLKKMLEDFEAENSEKKSEVKQPVRRLLLPLRWVGAAASILLLALFFVYNPFASEPTSGAFLLEDPFFKEPLYGGTLGAPNENELAECRKQYRAALRQQAYGGALACFEQADPEFQLNATLLYAGNLQFLAGNYQRALQNYDTLLNREALTTQERDQAQWQKMLLLFQMEDPAYQEIKKDFLTNNPNSVYRNLIAEIQARLPDF